MPANDSIHDAVKNALIKEGWTITHDPYTVRFGGVRVHADLAAEKVIAAEKGTDRIAVEIKSFVSPSPVHDFEEALGQFLLYLSVIKRVDPDGGSTWRSITRQTRRCSSGKRSELLWMITQWHGLSSGSRRR